MIIFGRERLIVPFFFNAGIIEKNAVFQNFYLSFVHRDIGKSICLFVVLSWYVDELNLSSPSSDHLLYLEFNLCQFFVFDFEQS